jgi:hypothetical protein
LDRSALPPVEVLASLAGKALYSLTPLLLAAGAEAEVRNFFLHHLLTTAMLVAAVERGF